MPRSGIVPAGLNVRENRCEPCGTRPQLVAATQHPRASQELSRELSPTWRTSASRLTQREMDAWFARLSLDIAEARDLAEQSPTPEMKSAVVQLRRDALDMMRKVAPSGAIPDISDFVMRAIVAGDVATLRALSRRLRDY